MTSTTFVVTRHSGAVEWLVKTGFQNARHEKHFDVDVLRPGDFVVGNLPIHLACIACERGARYFHLVLDVPVEARGAELTPADMDKYGARVLEYFVSRPS